MLTPNSKLHTRGPARRGIGVATPIKAGQYVAASAKPKKFPVLLVLLVLFGGLLMWQGSRPLHRSSSMYYSATGSSSGSDLDLMHVLTSYSGSGNNNNVDAGVLGVPSGHAVPLPNERLVDKTVEDKRQEGNYGGMGDSTHLGGFATGLDLQYISPKLWTHMVKTYNIKSVLDLGCGLGHASAWFDTHGVRTKCVDGSADALSHSVIAPERQSDILVEHDFARGPWWPAGTYDAIWCVDFLPQVSFHHMKNYLPTLRKAALIFVTTETMTNVGWHRVEMHPEDWWTRKLESWGFQYSGHLSRQVQGWVREEEAAQVSTPFKQGTKYNARNLRLLKVFVNPVVSSLPQHDHLFFERGCRTVTSERRACGDQPGETKIPDDYMPIKLTSAMDIAWETLVLKGLFGGEVLETNNTKPPPTTVAPEVKFEELPEVLQRIQTRNFTGMPVVPVIAWPYVTRGVNTAEHKHIEENGIIESPRLRLSMDLNDFDPNMVWVADTGWGYGWNLWCGEFLKVVEEVKALRRAKGLPDRWPIVIVDFTDNFQLQRCRNIEAIMGRQYVRYTARSLGRGRKWDDKAQWIHFGRKQSFQIAENYSYLHTPLVVRTDTVESLNKSLVEHGMNLTFPIETIPRSKDFVYLWPPDNRGISTQFAYFRHRVAHLMVDVKENHNLTAHVGLAGKALKTGRRSVSDDYIDTLLDSKIVVIAQRDNWEDHYRLMEALASGACVLHDFMNGLPEGLRNGTSILMYRSPEELESLLMYYLEHDEERIEIGRRGREVAMQRHRTWHRIEECVFGELLTSCESKKPGGNCPYIVHGDEN